MFLRDPPPLQPAPQEGNTYQNFGCTVYWWQIFYGNQLQICDDLSVTFGDSIPTPFVPSGHFPLIGGIGPWKGSQGVRAHRLPLIGEAIVMFKF